MQELSDNAIKALTLQLHTIELSCRRVLVSVADGIAPLRRVLAVDLPTGHFEILRAQGSLKKGSSDMHIER